MACQVSFITNSEEFMHHVRDQRVLQGSLHACLHHLQQKKMRYADAIDAHVYLK